MVIGPLLYMKISRLVKPVWLITASFVIACISGAFISTIGIHGPWLFTLALIPATLAGSITRPPSANLMMEQQRGDTGAVVSLMTFGFTVFGSIGMIIISLDWENRVLVMGLMYIVFAVASLAIWNRISKKSFVQHVLNKAS